MTIKPIWRSHELFATGGRDSAHALPFRKTFPNVLLKKSLPYRLDLLPVIPSFHRRARYKKAFREGQLVYYGPHPPYYGIGEVKKIVGSYVAVDFRGTGEFGVHEDVLEHRYLIPISQTRLATI